MPSRVGRMRTRVEVQANTPTADHSDWEPSAVAAEGILWMLRQPVSYSGRLESMAHLAHREGIMASVAARPGPLPSTELFTGVMEAQRNIYASEAGTP